MTPARASPLRPPITRRLAFRMGLGLCASSAAILVLAGAWNLRLQRRELTGLVGLSAERIAETIRRSTREAMLRNDRDGLHSMIAAIGAQRGITRVRVFNKEGRIRTSTDPAEVGRLVDKRAEQCDGCHQASTPLVRLDGPDRVRIFRGGDASRVLGVIAPIHNEAQCQGACHAHPASQTVLGVLDVQMSMTAVDEALAASEGQMTAGLVATVAAVLAACGLLAWNMVLAPVQRLTRAMTRVASGEAATPIPVTSADEIGQMSVSWNAMIAELQRARTEVETWNHTLEERVREKTAELQRAHERLLAVDRMASLGKLAAVVAHEINNPLAGILTYARLLRRRFAGSECPPGASDTGRILEVIDRETGRCGEIVRNLLLFSRSSPARFSEEDLGPVLERCVLLVGHQAQILGVELRLDVEAGLRRLECDPAQIEQLALAVVMNGLEATPSGGSVVVEARGEGDTGALLRVRDTGPGIPPEIRERIFEPFFTTKEEGKGVGLGLAVVYGIVERHHGRIEVESPPSGGTVFSIHFPWRQPTTAGAPEEP